MSVIFVTIGSMFPFDRMIRAMDAWAAAAGTGEEVLAQIGAGSFEPQHMRWVRRLDRGAYAEAMAASRLIVAHAGVGSVVSAGELGKPIVVLARRAALGEHTSDHQVETVGWLRGKPGLVVAEAETDLPDCIAAAAATAGAGARLVTTADPGLIERLRRFIHAG
jgi:UDP-N-acetylglucosamine transferase subunit ALG13